MAREPAHDRQPLTPVVRVRVRRQPRPLERQLGGDPLSARLLEELDEPFQQPAVLGHLEPEPATDPQIVSQRFAQRAHAAPPSCDGHGRASARSASAVDLGVYRGRLLLAVAQHLADLRQRRALPEHLGRGGVPQPVRAHARQPRPGARLADDPADRVRRQPLQRRCHPQEQRPTLAPRAAAQIRHHRLTDVHRQRQHVLPAALAANRAARRRASRRPRAGSRRPRRGAAPAARATTGSRSRVARPSAADRSWPAACATAAGSRPRGSVRSRRSATDGTAHTSGASISPATCR